MNDLKKRYNKVLESYKRGTVKMAEEPEKEHEIVEKLKDLQLEMNDLLMKIGNYTDDECINGFNLDEEPVDILPELVKEQKETELVVHDINRKAPQVMNTMEDYKQNWEMATQLAKSDLVPDTFKGKVENCIIALGIAQQTGLPPYTIMNNLNIVRGRASFSGSFCRTLIERTGKYAKLDIKFIGTPGKDDYGAYLEATRNDGSIIHGPEVTILMAKQEGWYSKKDKYGKETSKWVTLPQLMLSYRATSFFARVYEPSALNGIMYSTEEIEDMNNNEPKEVKDVL